MSSPTKVFIRINNLDRITIEDYDVKINGRLLVDNLGSPKLNVDYAKLGGLSSGDDTQAKFMNKDHYFPNESRDEQIKIFCVMQDVNGISHLNSPIKNFIGVNNLDEIEIEDDSVI